MSYALLLGIVTFLITVPWGKPMIRALQENGVGKRIRADGPDSHQVKMGTPTMGGILILLPVALVTIVLNLLGRYSMLLPLGILVAFGTLGAADDLQGLTDDENAPLAPQVGMLARHMLLYQSILALVAAVLLYWALDLQGLAVPGREMVLDLGLAYIPIAAFIIVATANAVNLTDGLDGLAGGISAIAFGAYGVIAYLQGQNFLTAFCLTAVGGLMAFLWFNAHPAQVFMGGVGSLALGSTLATVALMTQQWLILPIIGAIFTAEAISVLVQVGWFQYTKRRYGKGRRAFRMAPLHHHFELLGWPETQVTLRFWILAAAAAILGVALAIW